MLQIGYSLSSEEHSPQELVATAAAAERAGFEFAFLSDHYHPWIDSQGHSAFAWTVLGAIAQATERISVGTGVTCPLIRYHPALVAQMAATTAAMFGDRFFLGLGTGENLNEHILGDHWPPYEVRQEMLVEAVEIIRELWRGKLTSHRGQHYVVENARLYTLPDAPPPIHIAASGPESAMLAGQIGDGFVSTAPKAELVETFRKAGGGTKPRYAQLTVAWGPDEERAKQHLARFWPIAGIPGASQQELPLPAHFEELASLVTPDQLAERVPCGPNIEPILKAIREYAEAGFDHVAIHQIGDEAAFIRFYAEQLRPRLGQASAAA
jgi:G6PDH family F420-dependent oxidoreductase